MKKVFKYLGVFILISILGVTTFIYFLYQDIEFGGDPLVDSIELLGKSPHFKEEMFHNTHEARPYGLWDNIKDMFGGQKRQPPAKFPQIKPIFKDTVSPGLRAVWFGHASVLVEIEGHRVFFDPNLSEYAFLLKAVAPKRMNPPPLSLNELPKIDAVVISHDHYDHLDMKTVLHLYKHGASFFVGLGVGSHLRTWGIPDEKINEMDWGDSIQFKSISINCTEARHYSGRKSMSKDTLWTSWVIKGSSHTVFHSGDSGYEKHFKEIGAKFPNIDMALIKVGDYGLDLGWQDIHMIPEKSVQAHQDLGADIMIPIHWGVFELSYHAWNEPIERTLKAAQKMKVNLVTPKIGETVEYGRAFQNENWWRSLKSQ